VPISEPIDGDAFLAGSCLRDPGYCRTAFADKVLNHSTRSRCEAAICPKRS